MVVFRWDSCGITCLALTYASLCYADYVVVRILVVPVLDGSLGGSFLVVSFNLLVTLMVVAHLRAVFSDPGMVPVNNTPVDLSDQDLNNAEVRRRRREIERRESNRERIVGFDGGVVVVVLWFMLLTTGP